MIKINYAIINLYTRYIFYFLLSAGILGIGCYFIWNWVLVKATNFLNPITYIDSFLIIIFFKIINEIWYKQNLQMLELEQNNILRTNMKLLLTILETLSVINIKLNKIENNKEATIDK